MYETATAPAALHHLLRPWLLGMACGETATEAPADQDVSTFIAVACQSG